VGPKRDKNWKYHSKQIKTTNQTNYGAPSVKKLMLLAYGQVAQS